MIVQAIEIAVFVPLLLVFASHWGATGAAGAMLVSTVVFCAVWSVVLLRLPARLALAGGGGAAEGPRRLGNLAAGRRRARVARARGGGVPARRAATTSRS